MASNARRATCGAAAVCALLALGGARAEGPAICAVKVRSSQLVVLICTPGAGDQVWRVRSQAACAEQNRCNVWIWDQQAKAPHSVLNDADISPFHADAAVALWINESQTLIKLQVRR